MPVKNFEIETRASKNTNSNNPNHNPASPINETRKNYQTYPYDYYCGSNAKVFFGDVWVDDIVTIQYNVKQDKEPIYGYASQTFDAVARGVILVQGSFTIAFKEMGYLNVVQNLLETERSRSKEALATIIGNTAAQASQGKARIDPTLLRTNANSVTFAAAGNGVGAGTPQLIRQSQTIEDILEYKKYGNPVSSGLSKVLTGTSASTRDFEDFAELLEDSVWGDSNGSPFKPQYKFRRADEFDYTWEGNVDGGGIKVGRNNDGFDDYSETLNVMITFGDINDYRAEHTMVVLNDIHIVNTAMVVAPNGEPIAETYYFFARDINKALSSQTIGTMDPVKYNIGGNRTIDKNASIEAISSWMAAQNNPEFSVDIQSLSRFNDNTGWQSDDSLFATLLLVTKNNGESNIDQVIRTIETYINEVDNAILTGNLRTEFPKYSQWVLSATLNSAAAEGSNTFDIVIEQQIPNTLTYRVISPSRDNYSAVSSVTRDQIWAATNDPQPISPPSSVAAGPTPTTAGVAEPPAGPPIDEMEAAAASAPPISDDTPPAPVPTQSQTSSTTNPVPAEGVAPPSSSTFASTSFAPDATSVSQGTELSTTSAPLSFIVSAGQTSTPVASAPPNPDENNQGPGSFNPNWQAEQVVQQSKNTPLTAKSVDPLAMQSIVDSVINMENGTSTNTRGWKNNNPGNLAIGGQVSAETALKTAQKWYGPSVVSVEGSNNFLVFDNSNNGTNALKQQIRVNANQNMTLEQFTKAYSTTDQEAYIKHHEQTLGIDRTHLLKDYLQGK